MSEVIRQMREISAFVKKVRSFLEWQLEDQFRVDDGGSIRETTDAERGAIFKEKCIKALDFIKETYPSASEVQVQNLLIAIVNKDSESMYDIFEELIDV